MPPQAGQKGTKKKGGRDARTSRSRNTTPISISGQGIPASSNSEESAYTEMRMKPYVGAAYDEIIEQQPGSSIPDSKALDALLDRLNRLLDAVESRNKVGDRGMRQLAALRKERLEEIEVERRDEERRERIRRDDEEERSKKAVSKKKKESGKVKEERLKDDRPLTHGAHGLAPQDGTAAASYNAEGQGTNYLTDYPVETASSPRSIATHKAARRNSGDSASSSLSPVEPTTPATTIINEVSVPQREDADDDSADEHQPPPAPAVPHLQTFGDDPSTFPDPTVYEIREVKPGMTEDEIKSIYSVAEYPHNDLREFVPGTPPDKDFSNAKPTNQVLATTFQTYLDPYFRPFTEEDVAFLRERGDRTSPFVIPRRGKKTYREVWAEEDGAMSVDAPSQDRDKLAANQARGSLEEMDESMAETDEVSGGPLLSRLLATLRPEHRAPTSEVSNGTINGDSSMVGDNSDLNDILGVTDEPAAPLPPATQMPDSNSESWKKATHPKLDHQQVDERLKQELRNIGFLPMDTEPDYDAHYDDEIAARLRFLQGRLKEQSILNGARKARLMELVKERMAYQEYTTICEDLDNQVNAAYTKRTRTMGKSKKSKRPGGAGGGSQFAGGQGQAKPGIGDMTKTLMERRKKWMSDIGPVFDSERSLGQVPRVADPNSSIFKDEDMAEYVKKERDAWDEDIEEE
ncbi:MAG: Transcriptional regulator [Claussenomyces sp. TS43310]|nr:MAG: Transcriptional regulator [Claussenomyces sp. TS43310]